MNLMVASLSKDMKSLVIFINLLGTVLNPSLHSEILQLRYTQLETITWGSSFSSFTWAGDHH
jgi:hypothetical protein